MSDDKKYNGWSSYETWACKLWMDNDQGSYQYWEERAQSAYDNAEADESFTREERATLDLADQIKVEYDEYAEQLNLGATFWADMISAALSEVDWHEIAEHLIEDVDKETETADEAE